MTPDRAADARRSVLVLARAQARACGSTTIEAEHLLLALTQAPPPARTILAAAGVDTDTLRAALDDEFADSLRAVGLRLDDFALPPTRSFTGTPRLGTSAKLVLRRAVTAARARRQRRVTTAHLLLGLVRARAGTVPRALALAGVDVAELASAAEAAIEPTP